MNHLDYMHAAFLQAQRALKVKEVPVGAVIINSKGLIISRAHNLKEKTHDPCGHAEVIAIKKACKSLNSWRLTDCSLYVTLEPCMMCAGAIVQCRLKHIYFGAKDPKTGFITSIAHGFKYPHNHKPSYSQGLMEVECSNLLKNFFRNKKKEINIGP